MIKLDNCKICGKNIHLKFFLSWKYKDEQCDKCKNIIRKEKIYGFCSIECLQKYVMQFDRTKKYKSIKQKTIDDF